MSALEEDDSALFVAACTALVRHPHHLLRIFSKLVPLSNSGQLLFTSLSNLLRLLLSYTSAASASIGDIAAIAQEITDSANQLKLDDLDLFADVEDIKNWISHEYNIVLDEPLGAIVQTARDLVVDLAAKAKNLGFAPSGLESPSEVLLSFVRAKTIEMSLYHSDVHAFLPLFQLLEGDEMFESWYNGVVVPYHYYWLNFASLDDSEGTEDHFLGLKSYWDQFDILIAPLDKRDVYFTDKVTPEHYLTNVILPFAVYNENNLQSLTTWMFNKHPPRKSIEEFQLWGNCINIVLDFVDYRGNHFPESAYAELLRNYLAACIYFGIYRQDEVTPLERSNIYDQILSSANSMITKLSIGNVGPVHVAPGIDFDNLPHFDMFSDFVKDPENPFAFLFTSSLAQCLVTLQQYMTTCCELFPISQLTIKEYWKLKSSRSVDYAAKQRAISQILAQLDEANYLNILNAISVFSQAFVTDGVTEEKEIDQLVLERLLNGNLLLLAVEFYKSRDSHLKMPASTVFKLTLGKFWDLFNNASSLDERIGKLKLANQCVEFLNVLAIDGEIDPDQTKDIVRIKHLLNAILKLKNFKLVLEKNMPVTPEQVTSKLKIQNADNACSPISLISIVLEQNPKAYFAFEKLYKIASDLAIYLELEVTEEYLPKVQSACIESSLVDGNFDFAYKHAKELLDYFVGKGHGEKLNEFWLTFYQVGKFISPDWLNEYDEKMEKEKISTLLKQREILSLTLKLAKPTTSTVDNSRLIISQLRHINGEIKVWYAEDHSRHGENVQRAAKSTHAQLQENINGLLTEAANSASQSKNHASQKISKLLVSGLGWAIGAQEGDLELK